MIKNCKGTILNKNLIIAVLIIILVGGFEASAVRFDKPTAMLLNQSTSLTWKKQLIQDTNTPSSLYALDVDRDIPRPVCEHAADNRLWDPGEPADMRR